VFIVLTLGYSHARHGDVRVSFSICPDAGVAGGIDYTEGGCLSFHAGVLGCLRRRAGGPLDRSTDISANIGAHTEITGSVSTQPTRLPGCATHDATSDVSASAQKLGVSNARQSDRGHARCKK
jgi:hypothetical protein